MSIINHFKHKQKQKRNRTTTQWNFIYQQATKAHEMAISPAACVAIVASRQQSLAALVNTALTACGNGFQCVAHQPTLSPLVTLAHIKHLSAAPSAGGGDKRWSLLATERTAVSGHVALPKSDCKRQLSRLLADCICRRICNGERIKSLPRSAVRI